MASFFITNEEKFFTIYSINSPESSFKVTALNSWYSDVAHIHLSGKYLWRIFIFFLRYLSYWQTCRGNLCFNLIIHRQMSENKVITRFPNIIFWTWPFHLHSFASQKIINFHPVVQTIHVGLMRCYWGDIALKLLSVIVFMFLLIQKLMRRRDTLWSTFLSLTIEWIGHYRNLVFSLFIL